MIERVLLFGGSGFLGDRLARFFATQGHQVTVACRKNDRMHPSFLSADVCDAAQIAKAIKKVRPTLIINAVTAGADPAGKISPAVLKAVNTEAPLVMQREAESNAIRRFVQLGTCLEYAASESPLAEDARTAAGTPFAASKCEASERLIATPSLCNTLVLRLFDMWGPGQAAHGLVPQILTAARRREALNMGAGLNLRDFSFVDDMAKMIYGLSRHEDIQVSQIINVGSGNPRTVADFALEVAGAAGAADLLKFGAAGAAGEGSRICAMGRLSQFIHQVPRTPVAEGLRLIKQAA